MQDKIQEIMGLVHNAMSSYTLYKQADSEGWNNDDIEGRVVSDLALIKAKLRKLVLEPLSDDEIEKATGAKQGTPTFLVATGFVRATERAHNITNTSEKQ